MMGNPLTSVPPKVRQGLYLAYAAGGPVIAYCAAKGYVGDAELVLYASLGTALGLTAASNVEDTKRQGYGSGI